MSTFQLSLSSAFVEGMRRLLGDEAAPFFAAYAASRSVGLRANVLKVEPRTLQGSVPFALEPVPWCQSGFFCPISTRRCGFGPTASPARDISSRCSGLEAPVWSRHAPPSRVAGAKTRVFAPSPGRLLQAQRWLPSNPLSKPS